MERNQERDHRSTRLARDAGWSVMRIWEHEVSQDVGEVVAKIATASATGKIHPRTAPDRDD